MKVHHVIGLMSGTSLDGLDIAYCTFQQHETWQYDLQKCKHVPYPKELYNRIVKSYTGTGAELTETDHRLGEWVGKQVAGFMKDYHIRPELVVSHGQTVFHRPDLGYTLQIGNGWPIWKHCGVPVINDLRSADMALGGQGAPLVPVGDRLLFSDYDFCLNLGGFSNISYDKAGQRMAFDIGPVNIILNLLSQRLNKPYDEGGKMATIGKLDVVLFRELNDLAYYQQRPPKSLGMEWVEKHVLPMMNQDIPVETLLHTFTRHAALQIAHAILGSGLEGESRVLVTGGGVYNEFFLKNIRDYTGDKIRLIVPDQKLIDFKEALIFGFLGLLKKLGKTNVDAEVTGADRNTSGGVFYSA